MYGHIFYGVLHCDDVDGVVYVSQWPHMPQGEDIFYRMFHTDLSKEATGTMLSSGKPLAVCLFGLSKTISTIKRRIQFPIFNRIDEVMFAMRQQCEYHARRAAPPLAARLPEGVSLDGARRWLADRQGDLGEESMELLAHFAILLPRTTLARSADEAVSAARAEFGDRYDVALKLVSPDALHKTDVGGVMLGLRDDDSVRRAFGVVQENLRRARPGARFEGVRLSPMAGPGTDMFVGARRDPSFGPVVTFGLGGIYVEVFRDVQHVLCPANRAEIGAKLERLACHPMLRGARGQPALDASGYVDLIERVSHLAAALPRVEELDLNPVRLPADGSSPQVLDARLRLGPP
jgi:acetyltransferase